MPPSSQIQWACYRGEKWNGTPDWLCHWLISTFENSRGYTAPDMPESMEMTKQSSHHKWLVSQKIWSAEELETLPASLCQGRLHTIDRVEERESCGRRKRSTIFFERTRWSTIRWTLERYVQWVWAWTWSWRPCCPSSSFIYNEVPRNYSWNLFLFVVSESFVQQMCLCFGLLDKLETAFLERS